MVVGLLSIPLNSSRGPTDTHACLHTNARVTPSHSIPDASPGASLIVAQDHAKAARLWQEASERFGDSGARYNYAQCLLHGHGVPGACMRALWAICFPPF